MSNQNVRNTFAVAGIGLAIAAMVIVKIPFLLPAAVICMGVSVILDRP